MAELKGSKTEENLQAAFAGESQARNKYTYFAKVARKEGYNYIAKIFEETAENELIGITYYATTGDAQVTISDEHSEYRWVTAEDALSLIKIGGIKRDINAYLDLQGPTL